MYFPPVFQASVFYIYYLTQRTINDMLASKEKESLVDWKKIYQRPSPYGCAWAYRKIRKVNDTMGMIRYLTGPILRYN